jgi:glutathione S-transferase
MFVPSVFQLPVLFGGQDAKPEKLEKINEALGYLNQFLRGQDWVAGDSMTIADICLVVTVSNSEVRKFISPLIYIKLLQIQPLTKHNTHSAALFL